MTGAERLYALSQGKQVNSDSEHAPARTDKPTSLPHSHQSPTLLAESGHLYYDDSDSATGQDGTLSSQYTGIIGIPSSSSSSSLESEQHRGSLYESEAASPRVLADSPSLSSLTGQYRNTDRQDQNTRGRDSIKTRRSGLLNHLASAIPRPRSSGTRHIQLWREWDKTCVQDVVREVCDENKPASRTENRWELFSDRLASKYSINRSGSSIKNYWNREGRAASGYDERNKKDPDHMTTGVQDSEKRKAARRAAGQGKKPVKRSSQHVLRTSARVNVKPEKRVKRSDSMDSTASDATRQPQIVDLTADDDRSVHNEQRVPLGTRRDKNMHSVRTERHELSKPSILDSTTASSSIKGTAREHDGKKTDQLAQTSTAKEKNSRPWAL